MAKHMTLDEILKTNPDVSAKQIEQGIALAKELQKMGVQRKEYELASPFLRRRPNTSPEEKLDPRTINLTANRR